jgi:hypothetical protein
MTGTWINVIGYTQAGFRNTRQKNTQLVKNSGLQPSSLQAILIWDAGAVKLDDYEIVVMKHKLAQAH